MKKVLIIVVGALVLGGIGAGTYLLIANKPKEQALDIAPLQTTPTPAATLVTWDDPAGFTFSYPEGVVIDKHDEDKTNYAHVEMTHPEHPGGLIVWAKDLPTGVIDETTWVAKSAQFTGANVLDTTLGESPAKKILVTTPVRKIVTGTVSEDLLFYVESTLTDSVYWQMVFDAVTSSFAFVPLADDGQAGAGAAPVYEDSGAVDEEETLE